MITKPLFSNTDRVNPPANVTAEIKGTCLSIHWEKPVSAFPSHCFDYEVKIYNAKKGYFQVMISIIPLFDIQISLKKKNSCPFDSSGYSLELTKSKVTIPVCKNKSNLTGFLSCKDLF